MPDGDGVNGIEATRHILHAGPHIAVVMLTMLEDDDSVFAAMRAGARGYILEGADKDEILTTIRAVVQGAALFGPATTQRLMTLFHAPGPTLRSAPALASPN